MTEYKKMLPYINLERLKELKIFENDSISFTDDNKIAGTVRRNYVLVFSPIKDVRRMLFKYTTKIIYDITSKRRFYSIPAPTKYKERIRFFGFLNQLDLRPIVNFSINATNEIDVRHTKNGYTLRKTRWEERLKTLEAEIQQTIKFLTYKKPENPLFPLFFPKDQEEKRTLEYQISYYKEKYQENNDKNEDKEKEKKINMSKLYLESVLLHLCYFTGLNHQNYTNTVIAKQKDIRNLLPQNITIDKLVKLSNDDLEITTQVGKAISIKFSSDKLYGYNYDFTMNYAMLPINLLSEMYNKTKNFPLMLILLFPIHSRRRTYRIKLSNLVKYAGLGASVKKNGIQYVVDKLNACFKFFTEELEFLKPIEITKEDFKQDKAIEISHSCYIENLNIDFTDKRKRKKEPKEIAKTTSDTDTKIIETN